MRIAFLSPSSEMGGAERCLVDLVASLKTVDSPPTMRVFTTAEGPLRERLRPLGIDAEVVELPGSVLRVGESALRFERGVAPRARALISMARGTAGALRHSRNLRGALSAFRPDIVHTNGVKHHLLGALAAPPGSRLVWHVRDMIGERVLTSRLLRLARRRVTGAIAISRLVKADLERVLPDVRCQIVYDAIDVDEFSPGPADPDRLDRLAGFEPGPALRVGLVATYARWKGHDVLIEAARRMEGLPGKPAIRFYVVGGPVYATARSQFEEAELRQMAEGCGLSNRVGFVPFQSDTAWVFRTLDVAVHTSTRPEPFGRTIAEAMACGCPIVAASTSGAGETLVEQPGVLLVPPADPAALSIALSRLLAWGRAPEIARQLRDAAVQHFGSARLGAEVLASYLAFAGA